MCECAGCVRLSAWRKLSWKFLSAKNVYGSLDNISQVSNVRDSFVGRFLGWQRMRPRGLWKKTASDGS